MRKLPSLIVPDLSLRGYVRVVCVIDLLWGLSRLYSAIELRSLLVVLASYCGLMGVSVRNRNFLFVYLFNVAVAICLTIPSLLPLLWYSLVNPECLLPQGNAPNPSTLNQVSEDKFNRDLLLRQYELNPEEGLCLFSHSAQFVLPLLGVIFMQLANILAIYTVYEGLPAPEIAIAGQPYSGDLEDIIKLQGKDLGIVELDGSGSALAAVNADMMIEAIKPATAAEEASIRSALKELRAKAM